jgi:hypothetical protein
MLALALTVALAGAPPIEGKGAVVDVVRVLDAAALARVTTVQASGPVAVRVTVDGEQSAAVRTETNLASHVLVAIHDDVLDVSVDAELVSAAGIAVDVHVPALRALAASGQATITTVALGAPLSVTTSSAARITVKGAGPGLTVSAKGASVVDAGGFVVDDATVTVGGAAVVDVAAAKNLVVEGSGVAQVRYRGAPKLTKNAKATVVVEAKR